MMNDYYKKLLCSACFSAVLCLCYLCSVLRSEEVNVFSLPVVTEFG